MPNDYEGHSRHSHASATAPESDAGRASGDVKRASGDHSPGEAPETAPAGPQQDSGCPTPLAWQQVLTEFLSRSDLIEGSARGVPFCARVIGEVGESDGTNALKID